MGPLEGNRERADVLEVDNDFTTIGKRGKPLRVKPEKLVVEQEDIIQVKEEVDTIHHPDFSAPTTPFDVLFEFRDELLFWFSLPLLSCYSSYFAAIDWNTLRRPDSLCTRSGCIHLPFTPSCGFGLILHVLALERLTTVNDDSTIHSSLLIDSRFPLTSSTMI